MRAFKLATFGVAALLLAGCTSTTNHTEPDMKIFKVTDQHRGLPAQLKGDPFNASPAVYWTDKAKKTVTLVAYGSSSCPTTPTTLVLNSPTRLRLPLKVYPGACTADLGAYTTTFTVPAKVSRTKAVSVVLDTDQKGQSDPQLSLGPSSILADVGAK